MAAVDRFVPVAASSLIFAVEEIVDMQGKNEDVKISEAEAELYDRQVSRQLFL